MSKKTNRVYPTKYLIADGNIAGGFEIYGPFNTDVEADAWALKNLDDGSPWQRVAMYLTPDMYEPFEEIISNQKQTIQGLEDAFEREESK
jgi:hypothetical protein